jgi:hypothetical protein
MSMSAESMGSMQEQALTAMKKSQDMAIEAMQGFTQALAQMTPDSLSQVQPPAGMKDAVGNSAMIVDQVYDFAAQLLELNKTFVHRMLETSAPSGAATTGGSPTSPE